MTHVLHVEVGVTGLEPDVGVRQQREELVVVLEHDRALVRVPCGVERVDTAIGRFDPDDVGTEIGEQPSTAPRRSRRWCRRRAGGVGDDRDRVAPPSSSSRGIERLEPAGRRVTSVFAPPVAATRPLPVEQRGTARSLRAVMAHHLAGCGELAAERARCLELDPADELRVGCQLNGAESRRPRARTRRRGAGNPRRARRWLRRSPSTTDR